ncbi:MAG TPA: L-threonylcarbamoyladenylate synthase [bacterium]|nr:L-threonylcarbamoyladenylate synthase [bacterium]
MEIIGVDPNSQDVPRRALETFRDGGLVAFPTETFYALGAVASDEVAVARVFAAKRRPPGEPVPVLVADRAQWRQLVADLPQIAVRLADRFWPGPLTIVCRLAPSVSRALAGGGETIGVRQSGLPIATAICRTLGTPIVGTSANTHGLPSPVTAVQVALDLGSDVDLILDGGRCPLAKPSTVVDVTRTPPGVVRAGAVSLAAIREVLGEIAVPDSVR